MAWNQFFFGFKLRFKIFVWELVQSLEGTSYCWDLGVCQLFDWLLCFLHLFQDAFGLPWNAQLQTMQMLGQFDTSGLDHKSILKTSGIITYLFTCTSLSQQACYTYSPCPFWKKQKNLLFFLQIYPWNDVPSSLFVHAEKSWKKSSNLKKKIIQKKDETNSNFAFWWTVWFWNICCICILVSKLIKMKLKIWFRKFLFRKT